MNYVLQFLPHGMREFDKKVNEEDSCSSNLSTNPAQEARKPEEFPQALEHVLSRLVPLIKTIKQSDSIATHTSKFVSLCYEFFNLGTLSQFDNELHHDMLDAILSEIRNLETEWT